MLWLWVKNFFFVFLQTKSEPRIFQGWMHYWFAKKYAEKRKVICGKRHFVLPYGEYSLIVINRAEINAAKSRRLISKNFNVLTALTNAYYITK